MEIHIMCNLETLYTSSTSISMLVLWTIKKQKEPETKPELPGGTHSLSCIPNWYSKRTQHTTNGGKDS